MAIVSLAYRNEEQEFIKGMSKAPTGKSEGGKSDAGKKDGKAASKDIAFIPTIEYFHKMYAVSMEDQKAVRVFKEYESHEKLRRLQSELTWVKNGDVSEKAMERVIGKKRAHKFQGYQHWAELMMIWISQLRK